MGLSDLVVRKDRIRSLTRAMASGAAPRLLGWFLYIGIAPTLRPRQASARAAALLRAAPDETIDADRVIDSLLVSGRATQP